MAHFAQLDENNEVVQVIVVHNNELVAGKQSTVNEDGSVSVSVIETEEKGIEFCKSLFGSNTKWVQTSYNRSFRGKFAGIGDTFDSEKQLFITPELERGIPDPVVEQVQTPTEEPPVETPTEEQQVETPVETPTEEPPVETQQTVDIQSLSSSDLQSLTTTGL